MNKDIKVLLLNPPYDIKRYMGELSKVGWVFPPIGLMYLASFIRRNLDIKNVELFDFQVEDRDFFTYLRDFNPDIIGITCQTALVYSTLEISEKIKALLPNSKIIVGGVHASLRPQDLLISKNIDYTVKGEGEETFLELVKAIASGGNPRLVMGISYRGDDGEMVTNPERMMASDIDKFGMPAVDLIKAERYRISPDMKTGKHFGMILTARGCPYDCIFCSNKLLTKRTYRYRSIPSVIEEIEYYLKKYHINQFMIIDDNFAVNKKRTMDLCDEFIRRGYPKKFNWWAEARVDCLDEELIVKMKEAGCSIISLGIESGNQRLLNMIQKGITLENIEETLKLLRKYKIKSRASVILGLPTETKEESLKTIKFVYNLPLDQVRFSIATPFPGTKLWDIAVEEGKISPEHIDWTTFSLMGGYADYTPPYYPNGRTPEEIKTLQRQANLRFYFRPKTMLEFFSRIKSFDDIKSISRGAFYLVKSSIKK